MHIRAFALVVLTVAAALVGLTMAPLQWVALAGVAAGAGWLGWMVRRQTTEAAQQRADADKLRRRAVDLEGQVQAGVADAKASEERLRTIIDSAVDGIIVIDRRGHIESVNPAAERLFGYARAEVVGRNVSMLMPSPYHDEHDSYLSRYATTGDARIIGKGREVSGRRRDGSVFPLHLSVGQMTIAGEPMFTGILHDLSGRVALEHQVRASEARWRSIIQSAVDGIVVIDQYGRVEAFNPAAERLFGYAEHEVLGQNVNLLMPSPYHEEHDT